MLSESSSSITLIPGRPSIVRESFRLKRRVPIGTKPVLHNELQLLHHLSELDTHGAAANSVCKACRHLADSVKPIKRYIKIRGRTDPCLDGFPYPHSHIIVNADKAGVNIIVV